MKTTIEVIAILALVAAVLAACGDDERTEPEYCDFYCAPGSSFPCACNAVDGCNDGSACSGISADHFNGICTPACVSNADCVADIPCSGAAQCVLNTADGMACAYVCEGDWNCPNNMTCVEAGNGKICYPPDQPDAGG